MQLIFFPELQAVNFFMFVFIHLGIETTKLIFVHTVCWKIICKYDMTWQYTECMQYMRFYKMSTRMIVF